MGGSGRPSRRRALRPPRLRFYTKAVIDARFSPALRAPRRLLAAGRALVLAGAGCGLPAPAAAWHFFQATPDRPGIGVLAPAQSFPVVIPGPPEARPDADSDPYAEFGLGPAEAEDQAMGRAWTMADFQYQALSGANEVQVVTHAAPPRPPAWFGAVPGLSGVQRGNTFWQLRDPSGPSWAVGNLTAAAPAWGNATPMGGLQVSEGAAAGAVLAEGAFGYSSTFGRVNTTPIPADPALSVDSGSLDYGPAAGSGSLRYGLTPALTVESQVQTASALRTMGLGGTYAAGEWGTVQAAATEGRLRDSSGWRYALNYNVQVGGYLDLGYQNVVVGPGYGDLAGYQSAPLGSSQLSNTFTAGVPLGGLGTLSGTYTGIRVGDALSHERFGLQHSIAFTPTIRFALGADRDIVTGDYEMRMQLTLPMGVLGLP